MRIFRLIILIIYMYINYFFFFLGKYRIFKKYIKGLEKVLKGKRK